MTPHGKHRPSSHPVMRRPTVLGQTLNPEIVAKVDEQLDVIAAKVAVLPDFPQLLTVIQRARLRVIARELNRRADEE